MATEQTKPNVFTFDKKACEEKVQKVIDHLSTFNGKPGHNPFFYLLHVVNPLKAQLENGERTPELHNAIAKLELITPDDDYNRRFFKT
jgi:hypothetical protein